MKPVKKIVIYGDSISTEEFGDGAYIPYLKETYRAEIVNYAVGGSGLSYATPENAASILEQEENIPVDADLIIFWHGTNDWYWGSPLGSLEDRTSDTFYGAIRQAITRIRKRAPEAALVWCTPIYRVQCPEGCEKEGAAYEMKNQEGYTLLDYYNALKTASALYGFPLVDLRLYAGIHEGNHQIYLADGIHPNRKGYERIWRVMEKGISGALFFGGFRVF